jgi:hypothetical protein
MLPRILTFRAKELGSEKFVLELCALSFAFNFEVYSLERFCFRASVLQLEFVLDSS